MTRVTHLSASSLALYEQCPADWKARYLDKQPMPRNVPLDFGSAVHQGLEAHYTGEDGTLAFRRHWRALSAGLASLGVAVPPALTLRGMELIEAVIALGLAGMPERKVLLETTDSIGAPLLGYVDLWDEPGHHIYDFKTTATKWTQARADAEIWQTGIYSWAFARAVAEQRGLAADATADQEDALMPDFSFVVLHRLTGAVSTFTTRRTWQQVLDMAKRARAVFDAISADAFDCTCGKHLAWRNELDLEVSA